ncbi:MAG: GDP-L-fucose synthase, partial [Spirochaetaceae bacterium]
MRKNAKIYIAGHKGMVGTAIVRKLQDLGYDNILTRSKQELDLRDQNAVNRFFSDEQPEYVFLAAARVGGIMANSTYGADFIYDNLAITMNVIKASFAGGVKKLLNFGSSCMYPRLAPQPMKEEYLLTGPVEPTSEPYAIAKISATKLCRYFNEQHGTNFISVLPTNLYGPNDNFDLSVSHVMPALIRKLLDAKKANAPHITNWGDGSPKREFMYIDDLADAVIFLMERFDYKDIGEVVNVGTGDEVAIRDLVELIAEIVGYRGELQWDFAKPNGAPRKLL